MSVARSTRRAGFTLLLLGVLGALFFWVSDPGHWPSAHRAPQGRFDWHYWLFLLRGSPQNLVDAANQAHVSTAVGVAGSVLILFVGMWLITRRSL